MSSELGPTSCGRDLMYIEPISGWRPPKDPQLDLKIPRGVQPPGLIHQASSPDDGQEYQSAPDPRLNQGFEFPT